MVQRTAAVAIPTLLLTFSLLAAATESASVHRTGLQLVGLGEHQGHPVSLGEREAWQEALRLVAEHPDDLGYPWFSSGKLVMRAATPAGTQLASSMEASVAIQVENATATYAELERIKDDVMFLQPVDVSGADAIVASQPDDENNRVIVTVTREDSDLFALLAALYGTERVAVQIDPTMREEAMSRRTDYAPYSGGALFKPPANATSSGPICSLGVPWTTGFVTAGHCLPSGGESTDSMDEYIGFTRSSSEENWNERTGTVYMSDDLVWRGDLAFVDFLFPETNVNPQIYVGPVDSNTKRTVTDMWNTSPVVGDQYCTGGQKTGEICGWKVTATRSNVKYSSPTFVEVARNVTVGTNPSLRIRGGDSGGPVYTVRSDGTIAVKGIISGGTNDEVVDPPFRNEFTDILLAVGKFPGTAKTAQISIPFVVSNRNSLKCLQVLGGSSNGAQVVQWDCNGTNNQRWYYETHPVYPYAVRIINGSGKCLAIGSSSTTNGAKAIQWDCIDSSKGQTWYRQSDGTIVNHSGKCLAIGSSSLVNGANAIQWECIGTMTQKWAWSSWGSEP